MRVDRLVCLHYIEYIFNEWRFNITSRAEQKEQRRAQILEAALDQFIHRGYAATKIQDIADKAHMSVGLLFHYFNSKEALYIELIKLGVSGPQHMIDGIKSLSPLEFFRQCAQNTLEYARTSPFTAKMFVLMNDAYHSEGIPTEAHNLAMSIDFYRGTVPLIQQGQQEGNIKAGDPLALSTVFWSALQGSIGSFALNPSLPLPEAEWIVDVIRKQKKEV